MDEKIKTEVRVILDNYLESNQHRKTPERYAILDAVYSFGRHFTLDELGSVLEQQHFRVSRATLYNTMHLLLELRLVVRHSLTDGIKYEASYASESHVHQVCTVCGKVIEIEAPMVAAAVSETRLQRFRRDAFALYIYGVCSTCQGRITRQRNMRLAAAAREQALKEAAKTNVKKTS